MFESNDRPITIAMLALGGQGGGVLTNWLVDIAENNACLAQSTYVAGVAQRTGATVYCVEIFPEKTADAAGQLPVFTSYPIPGDVDIVIASEMAEAGRAIEKGFVTPNITTLIASSHRVYSMPEKAALGDGIMDLSKVAEVAAKASRKFLCFDMQAAAEETGSVISSVLLGAIAASGALPFARQAYEDAIRRSGRAVDANLAGFAAGFDRANAKSEKPAGEGPQPARPQGTNGEQLARRIAGELPQAVHTIATHGALRALDYQDRDYADAYIDRLTGIAEIDRASRQYALTNEVARQLALQMCYEDTLRVADLKTRGARIKRIREHVAAGDDQPAHIVEYFHPRFEEFCDTLPHKIGAWLQRSARIQKILSPLFRKGRNIRTSNISGFLALHAIAKLQRFRRRSYRYHRQQEFVQDWLERVKAAAPGDYEYAVAIARCIEIVKGYGATYERGLSRYQATVAAAKSAAAVTRLHLAALADEQGTVFDETLSALEAYE